MKKALVLLSGGLDSTTCLAQAIESFGRCNVFALNAHYRQKHSREIISARQIAEYYKISYYEIDLSEVMKYSNCSLLENSTEEVPEGEYAQQERKDGDPVSTYVPFRNGVLASVASAIALSLGADAVILGIHKDDAAGEAYPDCSISFFESMKKAVEEGTAGKITLLSPFVDCNKSDIVKEGLRLKVPYELTWSCYNGGEKPCGKCGTCIDRRKAFEINGAADPLDE